MNGLFHAFSGFQGFAAGACPLRFLADRAAIAPGAAGADILAGRFKNHRLALYRHVRFTLYYLVDCGFDQVFSASAFTRFLGHGEAGTTFAPADIHFITLLKGDLLVCSGRTDENERKNNSTCQYKQSLHVPSLRRQVAHIFPHADSRLSYGSFSGEGRYTALDHRTQG